MSCNWFTRSGLGDARFMLVLVAFTLCLASASLAQTGNIGEVLKANNGTTFYNLMVSAKLGDILNSTTKTYTVFAPNDAALKGFSSKTKGLADILLYHIVEGQTIMSGSLTQGLTIPSLRNLTGTTPDGKASTSSQRLAVKLVNQSIFLEEDDTAAAMFTTTPDLSQVVAADKVASNGVVHMMSKLLKAPSKTVFDAFGMKENAQNFSKIIAVSKNAKLDVQFTKNITSIFAPTDAAFAALHPAWSGYLQVPAGAAAAKYVLGNHYTQNIVYIGETAAGSQTITMANERTATLTVAKDATSVKATLTADGITANVIADDVLALNGVVQPIDQVILPGNLTLDMVQLVQGYNATVFVGRLNNTHLLPNATWNPFPTIFAPSNDAFAKVDYTWDHASQAERTDYLSCHLTATNLPELVNGTSFLAYNGKVVLISQVNNSHGVIETYLKVNGSSVSAKVLSVSPTRLTATPGQVYYVDRVLNVPVTGPPLTKQQIGWIVVGGIGFLVLVISGSFIGVQLYRKRKGRSGYTTINEDTLA